MYFSPLKVTPSRQILRFGSPQDDDGARFARFRLQDAREGGAAIVLLALGVYISIQYRFADTSAY